MAARTRLRVPSRSQSFRSILLIGEPARHDFKEPKRTEGGASGRHSATTDHVIRSALVCQWHFGKIEDRRITCEKN